MNFLSPILLTAAINIDTLKISLSSKSEYSISLKFKIMSASIFTTVITFFALCLGKIIDIYFTHSLSNIFGSVLLGFVAIYYIVEHIRIQKDKEGYDTSFYVENFKNAKNVIELDNPYICSNNIKNLMDVSIALSLNNIWPCIAGSLAHISIPLTVLFNFLICIIFYIIGTSLSNTSVIKFIKSYHYIISAFLLIILSLFEGFIA